MVWWAYSSCTFSNKSHSAEGRWFETQLVFFFFFSQVVTATQLPLVARKALRRVTAGLVRNEVGTSAKAGAGRKRNAGATIRRRGIGKFERGMMNTKRKMMVLNKKQQQV